jgi:glycosyltransferase involved in cell wall biosynthesis
MQSRSIGEQSVLLGSTIIPTIGRPTLSRAVTSMLDQGCADDWELIVVNDSGRLLPKADWQGQEHVRVLETDRRERSVARNAGAALARGRHLHFLDDDDWLLPGALNRFRDLCRNSTAGWLYSGSRLVDSAGTTLVELHHDLSGNCFIQVMAGEWIPLQASLISSAAFFACGGFNPLAPPAEDIDLCRRILFHHNVEGIRDVTACIERGPGSTTDHRRSLVLSRAAREMILEDPDALARMRASAHSSYWRGRIVRCCLTSGVWNLQHRKLLLALSRCQTGLWETALAHRHILASDFWHAVLHAHQSETFARGFRELPPCQADLAPPPGPTARNSS